MVNSLFCEVEKMIGEKTGRFSPIIKSKSSSGGCINNAQTIELEDGRHFFLKSNPKPLPGMFQREVEGLKAISDSGTIRAPKPLGAKEKGAVPFIVMESISPGRTKSNFQEIMGRQFALLHQKTESNQFGFENDNYIGSTVQKNSWKNDWVEFWRENRLGFQLNLARKNGFTDKSFQQMGERLLDNLEDLIGVPEEKVCLLHGDLWSGNYMSDELGDPVLIDPAVYYGRREADLAMTMLFGGFSGDFYSAYEEVWPLEEGSRDRLEIYKLYHLLNHLNLFGSSYMGGCLATLRRFS